MAAPLSIMNKLVLKNTTKMSLNERFTSYRAHSLSVANNVRQKIQQRQQASSANLRLAQQMMNRPAVMAALRLKKRSIQPRLGVRPQQQGNIQSRLNFGGRRFNNQSSIQGRLGFRRGRGGNIRTFGGGFKPGTSPLIRARLGQVNRVNYDVPNRQGFRNKRGNFRGGNRQVQGGNRLQMTRNVGGRGNRGGARGSRGIARGRGGRGRWNSTPGNMPSRQELDNQLDEYMAETKCSLDTQLGHYMAQG